MANAIGRPSLLNEALLEKAKFYLIEGYKEVESIVPSVAGLACYLGVGKTAVYEWAKESQDPIRIEFANTLEAVLTKQEVMLVNGGLSGGFNPTITKLMMANHGYSDSVKSQVDLDAKIETKTMEDIFK